MDAEDADLLYYAGVSALIERAPKLAHDRLTHYLEAPTRWMPTPSSGH